MLENEKSNPIQSALEKFWKVLETENCQIILECFEKYQKILEYFEKHQNILETKDILEMAGELGDL